MGGLLIVTGTMGSIFFSKYIELHQNYKKTLYFVGLFGLAFLILFSFTLNSTKG